MGIKKLTFSGQNNTAFQASKIHLALQSSHSGVLEGIGSSCTYSFSNNRIVFNDGFVSIYGRIIEIDNNTSIDLEPDGIKYGYVILIINTFDESVSLQLKEGSSLPSLQQDNISEGQGVFELPLVKYQKTLVAVTILENTEALVVKSIQTIVAETKNEAISNIRANGTRRVERSYRNGAIHYFDLNLNETGEVLLMLSVDGIVERVFPSSIISFGPLTGVGYLHNGNWYLAEMVRHETSISIITALSTHEVTELWIIK